MAVSKASKVPPKNSTKSSGTTATPTVSHPKSPAHQATRRASSGRFVRAKSCARKDKIIPAIASGIVKNPVKHEMMTAMTESVKWLLMQFAPFKLHLQSSALRLSGVQTGLFSCVWFSINFPLAAKRA